MGRGVVGEAHPRDSVATETYAVVDLRDGAPRQAHD